MKSEIIGQRINKLLMKNNMKQKELAKELGITDNTVSYFVNGSRVPNIQQIIKISQIFNVSTDYILGITKSCNKVKEHFSTRLRELREEKGLNQGQLADALEISRGSISFYENGERTPDIEVFDLICDFFNVSYDYMLKGEKYGKRNL